MRSKTDNNSFIRFLKDERFIAWKLFPTDDLNKCWEEYLRQHSDERDDILLAEKHFRNINVSSLKMPQEKKQTAIHRLEQSLHTYKRKRNIRHFAYAAACAAVLVLSMLYIQKGLNRPQNELSVPVDYIVGSEQESQSIVLITSNSITTFEENVDIQINNNKTARVKTDNDHEEEIAIAQHSMNKLIVPYGKRSKIVLPDGTRVWLNSGSSLEFPSTFSGNTREVLLTGEMYIEVAPDKNRTFYVYTSGYNVKVSGTKFNVSSYPGSPSSVVLVEGSVSLQSADKQELRLCPDEQAIYSDNGTFHTQKVDVTPFISWKEGYFTFEDTPVTEALKQIERYYNLSFDYDDDVSLQGLTCTGKIILSDNLDNVMTALTLISATKYKKEDKLIYIYKENESVFKE